MTAPDVTLVPTQALLDEVKRRFSVGGVMAVVGDIGQVIAGQHTLALNVWESRPGGVAFVTQELLNHQLGLPPETPYRQTVEELG